MFIHFSLFLQKKGVDIRFDAGFSLALAFWSRSAVLLDLNRGSDALVDIQCAIDSGLDDLKKQHEYYARLAKANARKLNVQCVMVQHRVQHFHRFSNRFVFTLCQREANNAIHLLCECAVTCSTP